MKPIGIAVLAAALCVLGYLGYQHYGQNSVEGVSDNSEKSVNAINSKVRNPVTADEPLDESKLAKIDFESENFNFGEVIEGEKVRHIFKFTNTGKVPLLISSARASCGCTVPTHTKKPVPPGEEGEVSIEFDSSGKAGQQIEKYVSVTANTYPQQQKVFIRGTVIKGK